MHAPRATYRALASAPAETTWVRALRQPALVALIIGAATAAAATGRITFSLAVSGTICWSFVPLLQGIAGALLIRSGDRRVRGRRAFELLFMAHAPLSLWVLTAVVLLVTRPDTSQMTILMTAVVPAVWNGLILRAYCREILGLSRGRAAWRLLAHQSATWGLVVLYAAFATQLWPRILGGVRP